MATSISTVMNLIQTCWTSMMAWAPVLIAAAFAIIGYGASALFKIIGARRNRGRRR